MFYKIFTDGGARGNPGPAAVGVVIYDQTGKLVTRFGKTIGIATNNVAEYQAVIEALKWTIKNKSSVILGTSEARTPESDSRQARMTKRRFWASQNDEKITIEFNLDSRLVASQLNGLFKVKDSTLRNLLLEVRTLEAQSKAQTFYKIIPREKNKEADREVNKALDY